MKFCVECGSRTQANTATGELSFDCIQCQKRYNATPQDTLMVEEFIKTEAENLKYQVFIENSPYDVTNKKILKQCPKCKIDFMTLIRIGEQEKVMYTCTCGEIINA